MASLTPLEWTIRFTALVFLLSASAGGILIAARRRPLLNTALEVLAGLGLPDDEEPTP
jgi:hypothetical protein